jgi:orotate phosphoribosyltransferase
VTPDEALAILERSGALLSGHFELTSGLHSDRYVQKARVFEQPEVAMELAREIASWYTRIDVVLSPAVGAIPLGFAVAIMARARSIFAERHDGRMQLRRGFAIEPGERVLVVEDVVTTGGSARECYGLGAEFGAERLGVAALVDRSTGPLEFPLRAVVRVEATTWTPDACPLCRRGLPIDSPGSRRLHPESTDASILP